MNGTGAKDALPLEFLQSAHHILLQILVTVGSEVASDHAV